MSVVKDSFVKDSSTFGSGRSADRALRPLRWRLSAAKKARSTAVAVSLDIRSSFDSIDPSEPDHLTLESPENWRVRFSDDGTAVKEDTEREWQCL